jgi:hypothetical protein
MAMFCEACFEKQQRIDRLEEENERLRREATRLRRKLKEGPFGSSTPSAKIPIKPNTVPPPASAAGEQKRKRGAQPGHPWHGRKRIDPTVADEVIDVCGVADDQCPDCHLPLKTFDYDYRQVLESQPVKVRSIVYRSPCQRCPNCKRIFHTAAPNVLPRSILGNNVVATAAVMHYLNGIPLGRTCEHLGVEPGTLVNTFHRIAKLFAPVVKKLIQEYRRAPSKHADETGWRKEGKNGYVWLFATKHLSLFFFRSTRSGSIAREVLGSKALPGVLNVDRYHGYNKAPCKIQYCYSHLLRETNDLGKEFPDEAEVQAFVATVRPLLATAMGLRSQQISDDEFFTCAAKVEAEIKNLMDADASHLGIRRIQGIFRENESRLYHWAKDRRVPADNNLAERDLRPTVIARKTSFGSQSDAGAHTRGVLMSILYTLKKRGVDVQAHLASVLNELSRDMSRDPFSPLFPTGPPKE